MVPIARQISFAFTDNHEQNTQQAHQKTIEYPMEYHTKDGFYTRDGYWSELIRTMDQSALTRIMGDHFVTSSASLVDRSASIRLASPTVTKM